MSDWLSSATRLFRGQGDALTPRYELRCVCGQLLEGARLRIPQSVACSECGLVHFILPVSPLPPPRPPRRKGMEGWLTGGSGTPAGGPPVVHRPPPPLPDLAVDIDDGPHDAGAPVDAESPARRGAPRPRTAAEPGPTPRARRPSGPGKSLSALTPPTESPVLRGPPPRQPVVSIEGVRLKPARNSARWITPVRVVLAVTLLVGGLGGWWLHRTRERARAEQTWVISSRLAADALEKGDLPLAAEHYEKVLAAINLLGRDEPRALAIRQTGRETVASARLCPSSLVEILAEAEAAATGGASPSEGLFRARHAGRWVVVDAQVSLIGAVTRGKRYAIDCPLMVGVTPVRLLGEFADFERLSISPQVAQRVIFAAQLQAIHPPTPQQPDWVIELVPDSGFLWVNGASLAALGYSLDEETARQLAHQSDLVGVTP